MKSLLISLIILSLSFSTIQSQNTILEGKITIADDNTSPTNGSIRFNEDLKRYEGYVDQQWKDLSYNCVCPYILAPFDDALVYSNYNTIGSGQLVMSIDFSHKMNPQSFVYGANVIVTGSAAVSSNGTLVWSKNNTRLTITTNEIWSNLFTSCFTPWTLEIVGTGNSPALGINGSPIDGDRDGCCGGNYSVRFQLLC